MRNGRHLRGGGPELDPTAFLAVTLPFYAGNLGASRDIVPSGPVHTDDRPVIDYRAPISHRNVRAGRADWFIGTQLIDFFRELRTATPPDADPYLRRLDPAERRFVSAGFSYHTGAILNDLGERQEADRRLREFVSLLPIPVEFETSARGTAGIEEGE